MGTNSRVSSRSRADPGRENLTRVALQLNIAGVLDMLQQRLGALGPPLERCCWLL